MFPADNPINQEVANLPASPNSQAYVESIGLEAHLHPDFGTNPGYGIPFEVVGAAQPKVPIKFTKYRSESDPGPYPIPPDAAIEGGGKKGKGDKHVLVRAGRLLQALRALQSRPQGRRLEGRLGRGVRPAQQRAAARRLDLGRRGRAADLPAARALPGGRAKARSNTRCGSPCRARQRGYIHPATHFALEQLGSVAAADGPAAAPEGGLQPRRLQRPGARDPAGAQALRADRRRQRLAVVHHRRAVAELGRRRASNTLKQVPGSAFEAVDTGPIIH